MFEDAAALFDPTASGLEGPIRVNLVTFANHDFSRIELDLDELQLLAGRPHREAQVGGDAREAGALDAGSRDVGLGAVLTALDGSGGSARPDSVVQAVSTARRRKHPMTITMSHDDVRTELPQDGHVTNRERVAVAAEDVQGADRHAAARDRGPHLRSALRHAGMARTLARRARHLGGPGHPSLGRSAGVTSRRPKPRVRPGPRGGGRAMGGGLGA